MSFSGAKVYARGRMTEDLGYEEWSDGFNFENIPRTMQNRAYHLELGEASDSKMNQDNLTGIVPLRVRLLLAGFKDPKTKIDDATIIAESVVDEFLDPINRLTQGASNGGKITNIFFRNKSVTPYGASNDNLMWAVLNFEFQFIRSTRRSE